MSFNLVYKGGYSTQTYNTNRHPDLECDYPVQSFQIEHDTIITHDQETLEEDREAMVALKDATEEAVSEISKKLN